MIKTYPQEADKTDISSDNIAVSLFGNRFWTDQSLYEYLIEFLLIFVSAKDKDLSSGKNKFHDSKKNSFEYWIEPRMGLRRFILFDKSKKKGVVKIDEKCYENHIEALKRNIEGCSDNDKQEIIDALQDLLHGYAVIIKNRNWCAQALLPLCPEMVFCEAQPEEKKRKALDFENLEKADSTFAFDKRNFLARGGEVYYLHILQALEDENNEYKDNKKKKLESLLVNLLNGENKKLSRICNLIQGTWDSFLKVSPSRKLMKLSFIPEDAYKVCGKYTVEELINYLSSNLPPVTKIEILSKGIIFQIMRMLSWRVDNYLNKDNNNKKSYWIIDMNKGTTDTIKKIAASSFRDLEDRFLTALNKKARELKIPEQIYMKKLTDAKKKSFDLFKKKGKELQCIIPSNGQYERFSLSEDLIRFLVLSLIPPQEKRTLDDFLSSLFEHYGIVIGPEQYRKAIKEDNNQEVSLSNLFAENVNSFQEFLKLTGFLRELSDATSIVVNPY